MLMQVEGIEAEALREHIGRSSIEARTEPAMVEAFLEILRICQDVEDATKRVGAGGVSPERDARGQPRGVRDSRSR